MHGFAVLLLWIYCSNHKLMPLFLISGGKTLIFFLSGFQNEGILDTMHVLLVYLQSSLPKQKPLVVVLLLHLDLLVSSSSKNSSADSERKYKLNYDSGVSCLPVLIAAISCHLKTLTC